MEVVRPDLEDDAAVGGQQFPGQFQLFLQAVQVGMDAVFVGVAEGLNGDGVVGDAVNILLGVELISRRGEVAAELLVVGRIHINEVDLAGEAVVVEQGAHSPLGGGADEPVGPVAVGVLIGFVGGVERFFAGGGFESVKGFPGGGEQADLADFAVFGLAHEALEQGGRADFFVDVQGAVGARLPVGFVRLLPLEERAAVVGRVGGQVGGGFFGQGGRRGLPRGMQHSRVVGGGGVAAGGAAVFVGFHFRAFLGGGGFAARHSFTLRSAGLGRWRR